MKRYEVTYETISGIFSAIMFETVNVERISLWFRVRDRNDKIISITETKTQPKPSQTLIKL